MPPYGWPVNVIPETGAMIVWLMVPPCPSSTVMTMVSGVVGGGVDVGGGELLGA